VRAETRTGGERKATNTSVPGTLMTSSAEPDEVTAAASTGDATETPLTRSGAMKASSRVALEGPRKAVAEAQSTVTDISIAAGVITIGSVTSKAEATSDGKTAKATGATTVTGMTIAGVPVRVDSTGLHVADQTAPNPLPQKAVNEAIKALGLQVVVTEPRTTTRGAAVSYDAGALVLLLDQGGTEYALTFGRASVDIEATQGVVESAVVDVPAAAPAVEAPAAPVAEAPAPVAEAPEAAAGTGSALEAPTADLVPAPVEQAPVAAAPEVAAPAADGVLGSFVPVSFPLAGGVPTLLALVGLAAVGFVAAGLKRLPDRVLALPTVECDERS
jgi:hypothetical protein